MILASSSPISSISDQKSTFVTLCCLNKGPRRESKLRQGRRKTGNLVQTIQNHRLNPSPLPSPIPIIFPFSKLPPTHTFALRTTFIVPYSSPSLDCRPHALTTSSPVSPSEKDGDAGTSCFRQDESHDVVACNAARPREHLVHYIVFERASQPLNLE